MELLPLDPDQLLSTTRSVRKRLDLERPVDRSVIEECLDVAIQAPTGSNSQGWHWVVVGDQAKKTALAELYRRNASPYLGAAADAITGEGPKADQQRRVFDSAKYLNDHLDEVPWMVIPCQWGRVPDNAPTFAHAGYWGSILPAVWSFMLALRARGLGSAWTTLHLPNEQEAADILGIPYDRVTQAGLFPVAWTKGTDFKVATRTPASELTHWDTW